MKLKRKSLLISIIPAVILIFCIYFASSHIVLKEFQSLEEKRTAERAERVLNTIANDLEQQGKTNEDWAYWDDSYKFVQNKNPEFIKSNLEAASIANLKMNIVIFLDNSNEIIFHREINLENQEETQTPSEFLEFIKSKNFNDEKNRQGIININKNPVMFTIRPVLTSKREGPSKGFLFFGKFIDDKWKDNLVELTNEQIFIEDMEESSEIEISARITGRSITTFANSEKSLSFAEIKNEISEENILVKPEDENTISAYAVINDIEQNPALLITLNSDRDITKKGKQSVKNILIFIILFSSFIGVLNLAGMQRLVVSPISSLSKDVKLLNKKEKTNFTKYLKSKDEISELAASINEMFEELKELDATKSNFLNIVSHELKTPLTAIYAYLDVIREKEDNLDSDQLKAVEAIQRNSHQLKILINNILEMSRIEAGKFELSQNEIEVERKINSVIQNLQVLSGKKNIKLISKVSSPVGKIIADEPRFEEIFNNLITNALKFTERGSVTIEAKRVKEFVHFTVSDTGVGIPKDKISKLFEKFYQVDSSISRKYGGTGLGLSITKQLIELQGGKIWAESQGLNRGTTFHFTLPIKSQSRKKSFSLKEVLGLEKRMKGGKNEKNTLR